MFDDGAEKNKTSIFFQILRNNWPFCLQILLHLVSSTTGFAPSFVSFQLITDILEYNGSGGCL